MRMLQPPDWAVPKGYANGVAARGTTIAVGGQIGWNAQQQFESDDFVAQARQALANVVAVLREAGAGPQHITRMTWYVVDRGEYVASLAALGAEYRAVIGRHFPAMTAVVADPLAKAQRDSGRDRDMTEDLRSAADHGKDYDEE